MISAIDNRAAVQRRRTASNLHVVIIGPPIAASGLSLGMGPAVETVLTFADCAHAFQGLHQKADLAAHAIVVIVESDFADFDNLDALVKAHDIPVIAVCAEPTTPPAMRLVRSGVSGCVLLSDRPADIVNAIHSACQGGLVLHPQAGRWLLAAWSNRGDSEALSPRSKDVLELVASGMANKQIARRLQISEGTVKAHLTRIFQQIGVSSRSEAAVWFRRTQTVEPNAYRPAS